MSHDRAKGWLRETGSSLSLILETARINDGRQGECRIFIFVGSFGLAALNVEMVLGILYALLGQLEQRKSEPGHFLVKLRQAVEKALLLEETNTRVKDARSTQIAYLKPH